MAANLSYSGSIAPSASIPDQTFAVTAPFRGVTIAISATMASKSAHGIYLQYATSIDGGVSYSDFQTLEDVLPGGLTSQATKDILINSTADHVKIRATNRDASVACTAFTITAQQFA